MGILEIILCVWIALGLLTSCGIMYDEWESGYDVTIGSILWNVFFYVIFSPVLTPLYLIFLVERIVDIPNIFNIVIFKAKQKTVDKEAKND